MYQKKYLASNHSDIHTLFLHIFFSRKESSYGCGAVRNTTGLVAVPGK